MTPCRYCGLPIAFNEVAGKWIPYDCDANGILTTKHDCKRSPWEMRRRKEKERRRKEYIKHNQEIQAKIRANSINRTLDNEMKSAMERDQETMNDNPVQVLWKTY